MEDLNLNIIADRIIDAVFEENIMSRDNLKKRIRPILSIWIKKCNIPKNGNAAFNALKQEIDHSRANRESMQNKYLEIINNTNNGRNFYRQKLINIVGMDRIYEIDKELN